jgi:hypothetical protein
LSVSQPATRSIRSMQDNETVLREQSGPNHCESWDSPAPSPTGQVESHRQPWMRSWSHVVAVTSPSYVVGGESGNAPGCTANSRMLRHWPWPEQLLGQLPACTAQHSCQNRPSRASTRCQKTHFSGRPILRIRSSTCRCHWPGRTLQLQSTRSWRETSSRSSGCRPTPDRRGTFLHEHPIRRSCDQMQGQLQSSSRTQRAVGRSVAGDVRGGAVALVALAGLGQRVAASAGVAVAQRRAQIPRRHAQLCAHQQAQGAGADAHKRTPRHHFNSKIKCGLHIVSVAAGESVAPVWRPFKISFFRLVTQTATPAAAEKPEASRGEEDSHRESERKPTQEKNLPTRPAVLHCVKIPR